MKIIRRSSFTQTPWKNGGGITHEAIRVPEGAGAFRWRVSVAEIHRSGPFSDFAGYRRFMVLLRGDGVRLSCDGRERAVLRDPGDATQFDGAAATSCTLLGGSCWDLNLMVSRSMEGARVRVQRLERPLPLDPGPGLLLALAIEGAVTANCLDGRSVALGEWDLAVVTARDGALLSPVVTALAGEAGRRSGEAGRPAPLVFLATLDDNSTQAF